MTAPLLAFRGPPPAAGSPLLAAMRLGLDLCTDARQLAGWWDWPAHRDARWCLDDAERAEVMAAYEARRVALTQAR